MEAATLENKRVLIVEDDASVRDLLKDFLGEMGVTAIYEAQNGFEALQHMDNHSRHTDLVICDWNMPGMSGYSVFRQLKTTHPQMPFIMVTSRADEESVLLAKESGMNSYLVKPLSMEQLEKKVLSAFEH